MICLKKNWLLNQSSNFDAFETYNPLDIKNKVYFWWKTETPTALEGRTALSTKYLFDQFLL